MHRPQPQDIYRHFKGNMYQVITIAVHSETRQEMVVYQALYGNYGVYCRPLDMFTSPVDHQKYPEVTQKDRFELIRAGAAGMEEMVKPDAVSSQGQNTDTGKEAEKAVSSFSGSVMDKTVEQEAEELHMNPLVVAFLDADSVAERIRLLDQLRPVVTDDMIDIMSMSIDTEIDAGEVYTRFDELKECLVTMEKFETNRLRS